MWIKSRLLTILLMGFFGTAIAQDTNAQANDQRNLLSAVDAAREHEIRGRRPLDIGKAEYWAAPGKFGIFEANIEDWERAGETLRFHIFDGPSMEIVSKGIKREGELAHFVGFWQGEITDPRNPDIKHLVELAVTTYAISDDGSYVPASRYRNMYDEAQSRESYVLPAEAYEQRNQEVVHSISGQIVVPFQKRRFTVESIPNDAEYVLVYEMDENKTLLHYDEIGVDEQSPRAIESRRRKNEYDEHVQDLKRQIAEENRPNPNNQ